MQNRRQIALLLIGSIFGLMVFPLLFISVFGAISGFDLNSSTSEIQVQTVSAYNFNFSQTSSPTIKLNATTILIPSGTALRAATTNAFDLGTTAVAYGVVYTRNIDTDGAQTLTIKRNTVAQLTLDGTNVIFGVAPSLTGTVVGTYTIGGTPTLGVDIASGGTGVDYGTSTGLFGSGFFTLMNATTVRGNTFRASTGTAVTASDTWTFSSPVIQGTVSAGTGLTMPAFTIGGNVAAGSTYDLATSTALLGTGYFTTMNATTGQFNTIRTSFGTTITYTTATAVNDVGNAGNDFGAANTLVGTTFSGDILASSDNARNIATAAARLQSLFFGTSLRGVKTASDANDAITILPSHSNGGEIRWGAGGATAQDMTIIRDSNLGAINLLAQTLTSNSATAFTVAPTGTNRQSQFVAWRLLDSANYERIQFGSDIGSDVGEYSIIVTSSGSGANRDFAMYFGSTKAWEVQASTADFDLWANNLLNATAIQIVSGGTLKSQSGGNPTIATLTYPSTVAWNSTWTQTGIVLGGDLTGQSNKIAFNNNFWFISAKDSGGTARNVFAVDSSNRLLVADTGVLGVIIETDGTARMTFNGASGTVQGKTTINLHEPFVLGNDMNSPASTNYYFARNNSRIVSNTPSGAYEVWSVAGTEIARTNGTATNGMRIRFGDVAGAATASDFVYDPTTGNGAEWGVFDTTNNRWYYYSEGGVHYISETAGRQTPFGETYISSSNGIQKWQLKQNDFFIDKVDYMMSDGAAHSKAYPFEWALRESLVIQQQQKEIDELRAQIAAINAAKVSGN